MPPLNLTDPPVIILISVLVTAVIALAKMVQAGHQRELAGKDAYIKSLEERNRELQDDCDEYIRLIWHQAGINQEAVTSILRKR